MGKRGFSYADAARLMGGGDDALVQALDAVLGGILLAGTAGTSELAVSLFDAKSEMTKLSGKLVRGLAQKRHGLGRLDQNERMAAAQAVIIVVAFFEAVQAADLPIDRDDLRFDREEQARLAFDSTKPVGAFAEYLFFGNMPVLSATSTLGSLRVEVELRLDRSAARLVEHLRRLALWDRLTDTDAGRVAARLLGEVVRDALTRWEIHFRRLATDFPELGFCLDRADHAATRDQVGTGLQALERELKAVSLAAAPGDHTRQALVRRYTAELDRPILDSGEVPEFLRLPTLGDGYIDPDFRAASVGGQEAVHLAEFWDLVPVRDDLDRFLVTYVSSIEATTRPLLVLGQPGAGKSVFTKFLSARLPANDFVVVRVVLRQVAAEADVQTQIEAAVRDATGEQVTWPTLSRASGSALRVLVFDGFDELLQTTGVGQSGYLRELAAFQEREADQERPVAVIVTSRVSVADRALMPAGGATVVHLEPFREQQVERWLQIWNDLNRVALEGRNLKTLSASTVLAHPDLAGQPLLLLMLALYDFDDNALSREGGHLSTADLYERLLERFARREVKKGAPHLTGEALASAVEDELHQLSIAALAMFNRGRQWVVRAELDADLRALQPHRVEHRNDFQDPATPGADAVGRFFFVHRTRSQRGTQELIAVEFLHATFGEYLVARLILRELETMLDLTEFAALKRLRAPEPDPGVLLDVLSFTPLTTRVTVMGTLVQRVTELPTERRDRLGGMLQRLFSAVAAGDLVLVGDYRPVKQTPAGRQAMQSLNLLLLYLCAKESLAVSDLFGEAVDPVSSWRTHALLWYAQCTNDAWSSVTADLRIQPAGSPQARDAVLALGWHRTLTTELGDPLWNFAKPNYAEPLTVWVTEGREAMTRTAALLQDPRIFAWAHSLDPLQDERDPLAPDGRDFLNTFVTVDPGVSVSVARLLLNLWALSAHPNKSEGQGRLLRAYRDCFQVATTMPANQWKSWDWFMAFVLRQVVADASILPLELLEEIHFQTQNFSYRNAETDPVRRWADKLSRLLDAKHL